jgi:hypothetical protein
MVWLTSALIQRQKWESQFRHYLQAFLENTRRGFFYDAALFEACKVLTTFLHGRPLFLVRHSTLLTYGYKNQPFRSPLNRSTIPFTSEAKEDPQLIPFPNWKF